MGRTPLTARHLERRRDNKALLKRLTDSPALPALVRQMSAPSLKRLIDHVGLRDAGALIEHTSAGQLREIFEEALWQNLVPGQAETLRPDQFLEWLDVLLDVGTGFAGDKLAELGDTFLVLNLAPLVTVTDRSSDLFVAPEESTEEFIEFLQQLAERPATEEFGGYIVSAVHEDEWEVIHAILAELETHHPEFLDRVIARCCHQPTALGFADDGQPLLADETYDREQRRERKGFVTPHLAAAFLTTAKRSTLSELCMQSAYDDVSAQYFAQLAKARAEAASPPTAEEDTSDDDVPAATSAGTASELRSLEALLIDAEVLTDSAPKLLAGPADSREPMPALQAYLDRLQITEPHVFSARLAELVFLANVLVAGAWHQGARFTEAEAAQAAIACANLGLEHLARETRGRDPEVFVADALAESPGLVRLFRIGWHVMQALPLATTRALLDALRSDELRDALAHKQWMLDEVESAVNDPDIIGLVERGEFEDVADNLVLLSLVLDQRACTSLKWLINDLPRFPLQLNVGFRPGGRAANGSRYLATARDTDVIHAFLDALPTLIKP